MGISQAIVCPIDQVPSLPPLCFCSWCFPSFCGWHFPHFLPLWMLQVGANALFFFQDATSQPCNKKMYFFNICLSFLIILLSAFGMFSFYVLSLFFFCFIYMFCLCVCCVWFLYDQLLLNVNFWFEVKRICIFNYIIQIYTCKYKNHFCTCIYLHQHIFYIMYHFKNEWLYIIFVNVCNWLPCLHLSNWLK